jgi:diphthamide biosynthesis protein 3
MSIYEEVEFEDLDYDPKTQIYTYPCPCGDKFSISLEALWDGEDIATCPSCTLRIEIIYDEDDLPPLRIDDDEDDENENNGSAGKNDDVKVRGEGGVDDVEEKKSEDENEDVDEGLAVVARKSLSVC